MKTTEMKWYEFYKEMYLEDGTYLAECIYFRGKVTYGYFIIENNEVIDTLNVKAEFIKRIAKIA